MQDEINKIKSRSFYSVASLLGQSSYSAALGFVAFFILTLKLGVHLLGIYATVMAMMNFFNYITDLGIGAAIMQKKEVEEVDLNTAFMIQLFLTTLAVIIGFFLTPYLFKFYKDLPPATVYLYWAVLVSFFFLSLKSIPSVLLEKKIEIYKVVLVQAVENTLFYVSIIIFASLGFEIVSLIIAVLLRSIVGTILIFFFQPWMPKLKVSLKSAKSLLSYGIPFQGNSFLALIKDDLLIFYLGGAIGLTNLGYVTFGKKYAEFSIRLIMDNINRVAFPLFARFQADADLLKKSLRKVMFYESFLIFPIIIGAIFIFDSLLKVVPGYFAKWHESLFSFYFFSLSAIFVSLSSPFINLFNAIGKVKYSLYFMILWTVISWSLIPIFIKVFGMNGISIAFFIMSLTFIFVLITSKRFVKFSLLEFISGNIIATFFMAVYLVLMRLILINYFGSPLAHLIISIVGGALVYLSIEYIRKGKALYFELLELFKLKRNG